MNRRHFLKFIPLIPIAVAFIKLPDPPKPAESVTKLEGIESIMARQKAMSELIERTGKLPYPANGHSYSDEEMEIIRPGAVRWIKKHIDQRRLQEQLQEQLNQRIREALARRGIR